MMYIFWKWTDNRVKKAIIQFKAIAENNIKDIIGLFYTGVIFTNSQG